MAASAGNSGWLFTLWGAGGAGLGGMTCIALKYGGNRCFSVIFPMLIPFFPALCVFNHAAWESSTYAATVQATRSQATPPYPPYPPYPFRTFTVW